MDIVKLLSCEPTFVEVLLDLVDIGPLLKMTLVKIPTAKQSKVPQVESHEPWTIKQL